MTHALFLAFMVVVGFQAGRMTYRDVARYRLRRRARSHRAVMTRILRLEMRLGLGLDYADDWLRSQPAVDECWCCGTSMQVERMSRIYTSYARYYDESPQPKRDPQLEARLCKRCIAKAHAEIESL